MKEHINFIELQELLKGMRESEHGSQCSYKNEVLNNMWHRRSMTGDKNWLYPMTFDTNKFLRYYVFGRHNQYHLGTVVLSKVFKGNYRKCYFNQFLFNYRHSYRERHIARMDNAMCFNTLKLLTKAAEIYESRFKRSYTKYPHVKPPADLIDDMRSAGSQNNKLVVRCAKEGGKCTCGKGEGWVKYGSRTSRKGDIYTDWRKVYTQIDCNDTTFGDPLPGTRKECLC